MPDASTVGWIAIAATTVLTVILAPQHLRDRRRPPPIPAANHTPRRCLETERATVAHHRADITQELAVVPQPRDGHSGHTVELKTLFAHSRSASRWGR